MGSLTRYFDLNAPMSRRASNSPSVAPPQLFAEGAAGANVDAVQVAEPHAGEGEVVGAEGGVHNLSVSWQIATYVVLLFSIVSSRFLDLYRAGVVSQFSLDLPYVLFLGIVSLLAFPVVYDRVIHSSAQPVLVRIGLIFTLGMGWEKVVATAMGK